MYLFAIIIIFIICIFGIIFGAQNTGIVSVRLFSNKFDLPLISVVIVSFAGGALIAFVLAIVDEIKLRTRIGKQQKEVEHLKKELGTLKIISVDEEEPNSTKQSVERKI